MYNHHPERGGRHGRRERPGFAGFEGEGGPQRSPHRHHPMDPGMQGGPMRRRGGGRGRVPRGDVRAAVLLLLAQEPMHGYQLMQTIADRSGGRWTPSPGAIYPTLNQLEDEGLVTVTADSGRKLVTLTETGRQFVDENDRAGPIPSLPQAANTPEPTCGACSRSCTSPLDRSHATVPRPSAPPQPRSSVGRAARCTCCSPTAPRPPVGRTPSQPPSPPRRATMTDRLTASAVVKTAAPERYAKQLASHLGRRSEVVEEAEGTRLRLAGGECLLRPQGESLELLASAPSAAELDRVTEVVGSHLERFGQRNELHVEWQRPAAA